MNWDAVSGIVGAVIGSGGTVAAGWFKVKEARVQAAARVDEAKQTADGRIAAIEAEYEGKLLEAELSHQQTTADRDAETSARKRAEAETRRVNLLQALGRLVGALRDPDVMRENVRVAEQGFNAAAAAMRPEDGTHDLVQRAQRAARDSDAVETQNVLDLFAQVGAHGDVTR